MISEVVSASDLVNLALGKEIKYYPEPNYSLSYGGDKNDLTDGRYRYITETPKMKLPWAQKKTVTWRARRVNYIQMDLDLGKLFSLNEFKVFFHSGSGAGVGYPAAAYVYVSNDKKKWKYLGNLIDRFVSQKDARSDFFELKVSSAYGRHIKVVIKPVARFISLEEFEVYGGIFSGRVDQKQFILRKDEIIDDFGHRFAQDSQKMRIRSFIYSGKMAMEQAGIQLAEVESKQIEKFEKEVSGLSRLLPDSELWRGPPFNDLEQRYASLVGRILESRTKKEVDVGWLAAQSHARSFMPFERQNTSGSDEVTLHMALGEFESASAVLSNNTSMPIDVKANVIFSGVDQGSDTVKVRLSSYALDSRYHLIDDALVPIEENPTIPAGMTRQLWLTIDSGRMSIGHHQGEVQLFVSDTEYARLRLNVYVYPVDIRNSTDYRVINFAYYSKVNKLGRFAPQYAKLSTEYHDRTQVVLNEQIPWPALNKFTKRYVRPMELDFEAFDRIREIRPDTDLWVFWLGMHANSRKHLDYFGAKERYELYSEGHKRFVKEWIRTLDRELAKRGITRKNYAIFWFDEANEDNGFYDVVLPFSNWLKEVGKDIKVFVTNGITPQTLRKYPGIIDIFCFKADYVYGSSDYRRFIEENNDAEFYTYKTHSAKERSPYSTYRTQHIKSYLSGADGSFFWIWLSRYDSGWSDVDGSYPSHGVLYRGEFGPIASKRAEAWRDGYEDVMVFHRYEDKQDEIKESDPLNLLRSMFRLTEKPFKNFDISYETLSAVRKKALMSFLSKTEAEQ